MKRSPGSMVEGEGRSEAALDAPLTALSGVGPRIAERLAALGIATVGDLLFHLPLRYEDRTRTSAIGALRAGEYALVRGRIEGAQVRFGRRRSLLVALADGTGILHLRFFHFRAALERRFVRGVEVACYGEARSGPAGIEMVHPECRFLAATEPTPVEAVLTPVYPATEGLSQTTLRRLAGQALARLDAGGGPIDHLPEPLREEHDLIALDVALRAVHAPTPETPTDALVGGRHPAVRRLAFEELLAQRLSLRMLRRRMDRRRAPALGRDRERIDTFLATLPFAPTAAQRRVIDEVGADLARAHPMHRLVQGDVGSGKTVVAAAAAVHCVGSGCQVALMAPTELLAEQHLRNLGAWLDPDGIRVEGLASGLPAKRRRELEAALAAGEIEVAVGTHALFQRGVEFARLGLVIIDEQHRFGVHQRLALRAKGARDGLHPHQLVMTATPIPRTLAMAAYADLDTSVIDEMPPGRIAVDTVAVPATRRPEVVSRVAAACRNGAQAFWVCTLIEESDALEARAAEETARGLTDALPGVRVGLAHGRMPAAERAAVMAAYRAAEIELLVATTVVEVGVDVPNASLMIIENAERLGLAQLHQLRGRVGRGGQAGACVLLYEPPLGLNARARLDALRRSSDGFEIAQRDLELRGPGEVLGTRQTGELRFRVADMVRDARLMPEVARAADRLLDTAPDAAAALVRRWIGDAVDYGDV